MGMKVIRKCRHLLVLLLAASLLLSACTSNVRKNMEVSNSEITTDSPMTDSTTTDNTASETTTIDNNISNSTSVGTTTAVEPTILSTLTPDQLPLSATDYVTDEMYGKADLNDGDLSRLASVMKRARNGEEITVAVIGGSITQGSSASPKNSYADRYYEWWTKAFPNAKINYVNAGLGGTTSYLGVHRMDEDLLKYKPDVVVVEYSVNDSDSLFYKETYEDLVRRILQQPNQPAVILLFMTQDNGTSAQPVHLHVGFWYNLPRLSYREMVLAQMELGSFEWNDISPDNIHPNDRGHAMVGEILWRYLNSVYAKLDSIDDEPAPLKVPQFSEAYADATILDSTSITPVSLGSFQPEKVYERYPNDWKTQSGNDSIIFETEAQNIGIMYLKTTDGLSGQFDVYVDDVKVWTLDADFKGGWGNYPDTVEVFRSKDKTKHKIEIKKAPDSTGNVFSLLGLLIS